MKSGMKRGFTLIELLGVLAITGLLMSTVLASLASARAKARDVKRVAGMTEIQKALEIFYDVNQSYPVTQPSGYTGVTAALQMLYAQGLLKIDPISSGFVYHGGQENQPPYTECTSGSCKAYVIATILERSDNAALTNDADTHVTNGSVVFEGDSVDCGTVSGGTDFCLDHTPLQIQT